MLHWWNHYRLETVWLNIEIEDTEIRVKIYIFYRRLTDILLKPDDIFLQILILDLENREFVSQTELISLVLTCLNTELERN